MQLMMGMRGAMVLTLSLLACREPSDVTPPADGGPDSAAPDAVPLCIDDDIRDMGAGDDSYAAATVITPTIGNPVVIEGRICNVTTEHDWFVVQLPTASPVGLRLLWPSGTDVVTMTLLDASYDLLGYTYNRNGVASLLKEGSATYYVDVWQSWPKNSGVAVPYKLEVAIADCARPGNDVACVDPARPVCSDIGACTAPRNDCANDDAADSGSTDDGPAVAQDMTAPIGTPVTVNAAICATSPQAREEDYYKVAVGQGEGLVVDVAPANGVHLDVSVIDSLGRSYGRDDYRDPKTFTLTYLPAGTYYVRVVQPTTLETNPYTIRVTRTAAQTCSSSADCAAEYATQLYRGACSAGACSFITSTGGALGSPCDSFTDCASYWCSYREFESHAERSVCTQTCTSTASCVSALGAGFACTSFSSPNSNYCIPSCASDLDCGTDLLNSIRSPGQPWHYLSCTTSSGVCSGPLIYNGWDY